MNGSRKLTPSQNTSHGIDGPPQGSQAGRRVVTNVRNMRSNTLIERVGVRNAHRQWCGPTRLTCPAAAREIIASLRHEARHKEGAAKMEQKPSIFSFIYCWTGWTGWTGIEKSEASSVRPSYLNLDRPDPPRSGYSKVPFPFPTRMIQSITALASYLDVLAPMQRPRGSSLFKDF
jgi:hypothetical protein